MFTRREVNMLHDPYFRVIREEEQFIENLKYSNLSATSLANIVKAANEIADAKTEDEISKLEAQLEELKARKADRATLAK